MIKRWSALALFFVLALPGAPSHAASLPDEYMKITISGARKPVIDIATNLPENMEISVDIGPAGGGVDDGGTYKVHNGQVHVGPFSDKGSDVLVGPYGLTITCPASQFQPDPKVQQLIGDNGQNLNGPDIKESDFGLGRVIEIHRTFMVN